MRRNRGRTEMVVDILQVVNESISGGGATRTRMMYSAYLNHAQMKEYARVLTESDLIRYDEDTQTFRTTEKGRRFLDTYNRMSYMIKEEQLQQQQMWI